MKINKFFTIILAIVFFSCTSNNNLFEINIVENDQEHKIYYEPQVEFKSITDSIYYYYTEEDYKRFATDVSKSPVIYKSSKFKLKVILRTYGLADGNDYEFILRTFSYDSKIIDSYLMGGNASSISCNGILEKDLTIKTTCKDGSVTTATIDEYGKFVVNE